MVNSRVEARLSEREGLGKGKVGKPNSWEQESPLMQLDDLSSRTTQR